MNDFFSMNYILSFGGMVAAVNVLTQVCKSFFNYSPRWIVLAFAFIVQTCVIWFTGSIKPDVIFLGVINACLVSLTAMGSYDVVHDARKPSEQTNPSAEEAANNKAGE